MIRNLLATTAFATLVATGAYAQDTTAPAPAPAPSQATPATPEVIPHADGFLAANIIGEKVYNGTADDAENIGNVNDIVLTADGKADQLVIGVGGFLGIGEKNVAVSFDKFDWAEKNGDRWLVMATTKEQLQALPDFDRRGYEPAPAPVAATDPAAPATDQTAQAPVAPEATPPATEETAQVPATPDAATADETKTAAIDKSTLKELPAADLRAEELMGTTVYGADDANIGEIGDILMTADGKIDAYVIDVGGFLGMGEKKVAVGSDNLAFMVDAEGKKYLYTTFSKEQLEAQPAYDAGSWAAKRDEQRLIIVQ
ncbi:PRC-barrel domain-containing protein [Aminobacter anthyllidis]|jgi:ribosomal 30S subunit maturation factor RimM|uniref:PRC-barrel domain-containing protein n=1 Tax=Aminobacter anthyllidis TaxID=1035067 RepID=A0A9X1ACS6_9HYPH|nr:PRC-barrel domain-containing protein [Aminobacter anthyllidis]MBT1157494.1 PRC-barrel domain-containing protein [Aminobacter anthyllidis]MDH4987791.1 PRC-barrel domain-containing protein [Aminobacter anthyllidis]